LNGSKDLKKPRVPESAGKVVDEVLFKDQIDYVSKVAKTEKEAMELIEAGLDFVFDFEGHKLLRKRKY